MMANTGLLVSRDPAMCLSVKETFILGTSGRFTGCAHEPCLPRISLTVITVALPAPGSILHICLISEEKAGWAAEKSALAHV